MTLLDARNQKSSGFDEKQAESVVETMNKAVNETVATKADLEVMASKLATKEELGALVDKMATKADLQVMASKMATKEELGALADKMATKDDIKDMATKAEFEVLTKTVEGIKENIEKNLATKADLKAQGIEIAKLETRMMRMMWLQLMVMVSMFVTVVVALP